MPKTHELSPKDRRRAAIASVIGTIIEWYDYFLYGTAAALIFPSLFFTESSQYIGTLEAFATFFLGFAARPIGGAIFGHFGDRIGRKTTLVVTLLMMGAGTGLIGVLPTYESIGLLAPTLLIFLRLLQGIGVGGEWGGSILLSMESGREDQRGLMASWPQIGVPGGLALSSSVFGLTLLITGGNFDTWGWRIPFLLSFVLVIVGILIRLKVEETPAFKNTREKEEIDKLPVVTAIKEHPKEIILSALARAGENGPFYLFTSFVLTYGTQALDLSRNFLVMGTVVAGIVGIICIPIFGYLSDVIGRKKTYIIGAVAVMIWAVPYFGIMNTAIPGLVFLAIVISLIPHSMLYGPQAALIAESFPARVRYSGSSLGYQLTSLIAGGPAPMIATFLLHNFGPYAISGFMIFYCMITIIATSFLKDRTKQEVSVDPSSISMNE